MTTRHTDQEAEVKSSVELADMGSIFDAAWRRLRAMGLIVREREDQQRNRLAGIVIRLMHDGQNTGPDIVSDAAEDFRRSSAQGHALSHDEGKAAARRHAASKAPVQLGSK